MLVYVLPHLIHVLYPGIHCVVHGADRAPLKLCAPVAVAVRMLNHVPDVLLGAVNEKLEAYIYFLIIVL